MDNQENPVKKKRGRKPKNANPDNNAIPSPASQQDPPVPKKRGRKPKGGKLINKITSQNENPVEINNVILHLKCYLNDIIQCNNFMTNNISYNPNAPPQVESFNSGEQNFASFERENNDPSVDTHNITNNNIDTNNKEDDSINDTKAINQKLKALKLLLYKNNNCDKKSACFWCTYDFDCTPCYIPMQDNNNDILGYGSFCRPECATAFLMKENIDDSVKFERYHLLNKYYSKVYNYTKSIKPSPDPYYTLDKFYGNLSIKEYRKLTRSDHMLVTINKPFSKSLPELHEENDTLVSDIYGCGNPNNHQHGTYKVKRESEKQKGPNKSTIIAETFGFKK